MGRRARAILRLAFITAGLSAASAISAPPAGDVLRDHLDLSVRPGADFFGYANGGWFQRNPIPASESTWGIGGAVVEQIQRQLRVISEEAAAGAHPPGSDAQRIGDFWATAMDEARAEKLGVQPLKEELGRIDAIHTPAEALDAAFALQRLGVNVLFSLAVSPDEKRSDAPILHLYQGGLGLPDRDFYFNGEQGVVHVREEYVPHIARTLVLLGRDPMMARQRAEAIMAFETALAQASRRLEDLRDPQRNYNRMSPAELTAGQTPSIAWGEQLARWGTHEPAVIVGQPEFFDALEHLVQSTPVPVLQDYLRFHLVSDYSDALSAAFVEEFFHFNRRVLAGQPEQKPRWKRVIDAENDAIGMIVGRAYVHRHFPEAAKQRYTAMVDAIRTAYHDRIQRLDWMSAATKARALRKLAVMGKKVGYPDKWKDDSGLRIARDSYCANVMRARRWAFGDALAKLGKPVDHTEWEMTPQTYNAYYEPTRNEIVLPAAIFAVPGMADADLDDALAYGNVGASTIGHEITHGFDDTGRQFDEVGNLADWWTAEDAAGFQQRAQRMVQQFDAYEPLPGLHVNGKASLGENIADYGGLLLGLEAFHRTAQYRDGTRIAGLTPDQRFFLGYALGWLVEVRDERLRQQLLSDVHAPAKWRVNGPLSNMPEFYQAFDVKPGDPMYRPKGERVHIW